VDAAAAAVTGRGVRARGWLALAALALSACAQQPSRPAPLFDHLRVSAAARTYHPTTSVGLPVSVVQVADGTYLVCDYADVYRVARTASGYAVTALGRPQVPVWTPAGMDYRDGSLYVANYRGPDVLQLRLQGDKLALVRRIAGPDLSEPKHVRAEADGSVVVADHNGSAVVKLGPDGSRQWRVKVDQANGVTESGGSVYATSLASGRITKIDRSGRVVLEGGSPGVAAGGFRWPVDVADLGDRIAVTDAINGRITLLDHDLRVVGHVGANGPGLDALNYPFATLPVADGYLVADSFKQRLLHLDRGWTVQEQVALGPSVPVGRERPLVFGSPRRPTTYDMLPGVDIAAELGLRKPLRFVGGEGGLDQAGGERVHLDVGNRDFGTMNAVWADRAGRYVVVGSPQSHLLLVIDPPTGMFTFVEVGEDSWWRGGFLLLSVNLRRALVDVVQSAVAAFDRARRLLEEGTARPEVLRTALAGELTKDWAAELTSQGGQQFAQSPMSKADAATYDTWALRQREQRVIELLEVKFLSGS
jgi:hypothetical protein